jgi:hypothetical protein
MRFFGVDANLPLDQILRHGREIEIGSDLARRILAECAYEHQRLVKRHQVGHLVNQIKRGKFTQGLQINLVRRRDTGQLVHVNSQHRLLAVIESGVPQRFMVHIVEVDDSRGVEEEYKKHDQHAKRSPSDLYRHLVDRVDLSLPQVNATVAAVKIIMCKYQSPHPKINLRVMDSSEVERACHDWWPTARAYFEAITGARRDLGSALRRAPVMSVALMTLRHASDKAFPFWSGLAADDHLGKDDARKALGYYLIDKRSVRTLATEIRSVAAAWNAFFAGRRIRNVPAHLPEQLVIAGTPVGASEKR